jgi:hypothetical protein
LLTVRDIHEIFALQYVERLGGVAVNVERGAEAGWLALDPAMSAPSSSPPVSAAPTVFR